MMDALGIQAQLAAVQGSLDLSMKSIQTAVMRLETAGPEFSDALSALRETHRLLFHLDRNIVDAIQASEQGVAL